MTGPSVLDAKRIVLLGRTTAAFVKDAFVKWTIIVRGKFTILLIMTAILLFTIDFLFRKDK